MSLFGTCLLDVSHVLLYTCDSIQSVENVKEEEEDEGKIEKQTSA